MRQLKNSVHGLVFLLIFLSACFNAATASPVKPKLGSIKKKRPYAGGQILSFSIPQQLAPAVIDETNHFIAIVVHAGTDITSVAPTITVTPGYTVSPTSGTTQNFTSAVAYIVSDINGVQTTYYSVNVLPTRVIAAGCPPASTTIPGDPTPPQGQVSISYQYQWQMLNSGGVWIPAPGPNAIDQPDYQTPAFTNNTGAPVRYTFRRQLTTNFGITYDSYSDYTVNPPLSGGAVISQPPGSQSIFCGTTDAEFLNGPAPTGSDGNYTYQWQNSVNGAPFNDIIGATLQGYLAPASAVSISYQRIITSSTCAPVVSNAIIMTVQPVLTPGILAPPAITTFCESGTPGTLGGTPATGGDGTPVYQWAILGPNGIPVNIIGATTDTYNPGTVTSTTTYVRLVTSGACSTPVASNSITITIQPPIANNTINPPQITTVCAAGRPGIITGSLPTGGDGVTYQYKWQILNSNGVFVDISDPNANTTGQNYDPGIVTVTSTYQRLVTSGTCNTPLASNPITVTVQPAMANNLLDQPQNNTFCVSGDPGTILGATPTGGDGINYQYQWQILNSNGVFVNVSGTNGTGPGYDPGTVTVTSTYQRLATSGACNMPLPSNPIIITIQNVIANNIITPPNLSKFCISGDPDAITGNVPTGGDGANYTYQWQNSTDGVNFSNISGATGPNYDPGNLTVTTYFQRMAVSGSCSTPTASNIVTIKITQQITQNSINSPLITKFCTSVDPAIISGSPPLGGDGPGTYTYQWLSSTDDGVTWNAISGATGIDYDPPRINVSTWIMRTVTSGECSIPSSDIVKFTIKPSPTSVAVDAPQPICAGSTATLKVSSPDADLTYLWYDSPEKTNQVGQGAIFTTNPLNATQTFYVVASNGICSSPSASSVTVTVNGIPAVPIVSFPTSVCNGSPAHINVDNSQNGLTYNWYTTPTGGQPLGPTTPYFDIPSINGSGTWYVEAVNSTGCISAARGMATITGTSAPIVSVQPASACPNTTVTLTSDNSDPDISVYWYSSATDGSPLSGSPGNSFTTPAITANTTFYAEAQTSSGCKPPNRTAVKVTLIQPLAAPSVTVGAITETSLTFNWDAVDGATGYQYSIDNGQTFSSPSEADNALSQTISNLALGQSVTMIVRAVGNIDCELSAYSAAVTGTTVAPPTDNIFVANAFTPNGDGKNDIVYVHGENIKSIKFYVYDQWGEMLYTSLNLSNGWDGTYKGKLEPVGVYVYYLEAIMNDGKQVNKKGTITLLR